MSDEKQGPQGFSDPADWLRAEYLRRRGRNPQYSLRAFARQIKLPVGSLSEFLAKRRPLSAKTGERLATSLALSPGERESLLNLISVLKARRKRGNSPGDYDEEIVYRELPADVFDLIAEWYHFGILALMETQGFQSDPAWISARLGICVTEVRAALDRMVRLNLLEQTEDGFKASGQLSSTQDIPSGALRRFHTQLLDRAKAALGEVSVESRDITAITMAIDPSKLPEAKKKIRKFRRHLAKFLESGKRTEVYHLNVQLVPASNGVS